jgi:Ca2+-binding EF-hand superfamily protein
MTSNDSKPDGELQKLFSRFDTDLNELIDFNEFRKMLQSLGHESIAEVLDLEFASIDTDGDGGITFEEFANWWRDYEQE